jgi:hypothetical protein
MTTGQTVSAIDTLVTAISLIKQSKVAHDERCKIFVSSLLDTKKGIEEKFYGGSVRGDRSMMSASSAMSDGGRDRDR